MSNHLKRLAAPKSWPIERKGSKFVTKSNPGAHPLDKSVPLNILLKDILRLAKTTREVKKILKYNNILIDCVKRSDIRHPVGLMDTIEINELKKYYRIGINKKGKISVTEINNEESSIKPCKIIKKTIVKGKTQLNLYDGRNIIVDKNGYKTGDTLVIKLPNQEIAQHIKLEKGCSVLLTAGKHIGEIGSITDIIGNKAKYTLPTGEVVETWKEHVFVIGKEKPVVKI